MRKLSPVAGKTNPNIEYYFYYKMEKINFFACPGPANKSIINMSPFSFR